MFPSRRIRPLTIGYVVIVLSLAKLTVRARSMTPAAARSVA